MIILVAGLPATGKSTIARALAKELDAVILRTDVVRKELLDTPTYSREEKELVYRVTFLIAEYLTRARVNVILDATFYRRELRHRAYAIARRTESKLLVVECSTPREVIKERMKKRKEGRAVSDADLEVYDTLAGEFEPIQRPHMEVDTSRPLKENLREIMQRLEVLGVL